MLFRSLDVLASGLNFMAVRVALTPADEGHSFGHGKAEPLSALGQAAFIAGSAVLVVVEAISRLSAPAPVPPPTLAQVPAPVPAPSSAPAATASRR